MNNEQEKNIEQVSIAENMSTTDDDGGAERDSNLSHPAGEDNIAERDEGGIRTQLAEMTDKYLRTAAELENTRRRAELDAQNLARNRAMSVATKFLPLVDAIDAAKKHNPDDTGILLMARAADDALAQIGITKIESIGHQLNPQFHNAIQVVEPPLPADDNTTKIASNTVIDEMQSGYMFGDTVLRPAMVVVAK
jgi:molecular chaperone GrpE